MSTASKRINQYKAKHDFDFRSVTIKKGETIYIVHQHFGSTDRSPGHPVNAVVTGSNNWIGDCSVYDYQENLGNHIELVKKDISELHIN